MADEQDHQLAPARGGTRVGDRRLSAVQYLVFTLSGGPVRLGSNFAALELVVDLDEAQQAALAADLAATLG